MYKHLIELKNIHADRDIYILGSGKSMDFMPLSFYDDKITIGINLLYKYYACTYIFLKDIVTARGLLEHLIPANDVGCQFITTTHHRGKAHIWKSKLRDYYVAPAGEWGGFIDKNLIDTDTMVNSHSSITTAIHIAYYMGARNIILSGIDCGLLDDQSHMTGYYTNELTNQLRQDGEQVSHGKYWRKAMSHPYHLMNITAMRDELAKRGCNVVSLSPFVNIGNEGHIFTTEQIPPEEFWAGKNFKL